MTTIHDFQATALNGAPVDLAQYRDKVLLIVNSASACGFTPQYKGLQELYGRFGSRGLMVLAFPCNQFRAQEPGSAEQIGAFCDEFFSVTFPLFAKIDVNGPNAHPLFQFLKKEAPGMLGTEAIKWNFTKFLVRKDGSVYKRYGSITEPKDLARDIKRLLAE